MEGECSAIASLREHNGVWDPDVFETMYDRILCKTTCNSDDIVETEAVLLEDVEIVVVAYGSTSWPALEAVYQAREKGIRMGLLRLITVWSVPDREMAAAAENASTVLSIEMNVSKYYSEVERYVEGRCPVKRVTKSRGGIHNAEDVLAAIERVTR